MKKQRFCDNTLLEGLNIVVVIWNIERLRKRKLTEWKTWEIRVN